MAKRKRETKPVMISQALLNSYRSQVDKQGDRAAQFMESAIGTYMKKKPDATVAQVREFTYELMQSALPNFTDLSETLSCEFMEMLASKYGWDDVRPELFDTTDYELVDRKLHYLAGLLTEDKDDEFKHKVADVTKYYVKRAAQENMIKNCDKAEVRYARVPTGFETCSFCFMLASRGFEYRDEMTAGLLHKFHEDCDCIVVPGAKGRTKIDGYDPEGMYQRWESCEKAIGGSKQAKVEWDALDEAKRNDYIMKARGDNARAFRDFQRDRIQCEVETRDWHWLYTGEAPKIDYSKSPRSEYGTLIKPGDYSASNISKPGNEWRDLIVHDTMANNGFYVETRSAKDVPDGFKHIDLYINGELWEVKSPENMPHGNSPRDPLEFISRNLKKANSQFRHQYDHDTGKELDYEENKRVIFNMAYKDMPVNEEFIARLKSEMINHDIDELILINTDQDGIAYIEKIK